MYLSRDQYNEFEFRKINRNISKLYYEGYLAHTITDAYTEGIGNFLKNIWKNIKDFFKWIKDYIMLIWNKKLSEQYKNLMMNRKFNLASREYKLTWISAISTIEYKILVTTKETTLYNIIMNSDQTNEILWNIKEIESIEQALQKKFNKLYNNRLANTAAYGTSEVDSTKYDELQSIYTSVYDTLQTLIKFRKDFEQAISNVKKNVEIE